MALHKIVHKKHSTVPDSSNTDLVRASDWNEDHNIVWGFATPNKISITSEAGTSEGDALFDKVQLLLSADGAVNTSSFLDYSAKNINLTANGSYHSSYTSRFGTASARFDGVDDYITGTLKTAIGTDDFCIEAWVYLDPVSVENAFIFDNRPDESTGMAVYVEGTSGSLCIWWNTVTFSNTYVIPSSTWVHVCVERLAGVAYMYVNGTRVHSTAYPHNSTTKSFKVGHCVVNNGTTRGFYLQDLRVTSGAVRYTQVTAPSGELLNPAGSDYDPYWDNVRLLAHMNGSNGSSTILDEKAHAITPTGTASISTAQSKFGGSSLKLNGAGDYLTIASDGSFSAAGNFTVECWVYLNAVKSQAFVSKYVGTAAGFQLYTTATNQLTFMVSAGSYQYASDGAAIPTATWTHVAGVKNGNTISTYMDGVLQASFTLTGTGADDDTAVTIGRDPLAGSLQDIDGYLNDVRFTQGVARYTQNFVPPIAAAAHGNGTSDQDPVFSNVGALVQVVPRVNGDAYAANVVLYMRGNTLTDDTGNPVTAFGDAAVSSAQSKFGTGSLYFDGAGDYLSLALNSDFDLEASDFTVEAFVNVSGGSGPRVIIGKAASFDQSYYLYYTDNNLVFTYTTGGGSSVSMAFPTTLTLGQWYHVAVSRQGLNLYLFLDGELVASSGTASNWYKSTTPLLIGAISVPSYEYYWNGYIDDLRITKGVARYTSNFVPPTSEIPASAPFIQELTGKTVSITGEARATPTAFKFNNASILFDGTDDAVNISAHASTDIGAGDFTMEAWVNLTYSGGAYQDIMIFESAPNIGVRFGDSDYGYKLQCGVLNAAATCYSCSWVQSEFAGAWRHVAFVRQAGKMMLFVDGSQQMLGSGANPGTYPNTYFTNNTNQPSSILMVGGGTWNGYIQEARLTKGVARYTANFQPNTRPFPSVAAISETDNWWRGVSLYAKFNDTADASLTNKAITLEGDAVIDATSKFGSGSLMLSGAGWASLDASPDWNFSVTPFTVECWIKTSAAKDQSIVSAQTDTATGWSLNMTTAGLIQFNAAGNTVTLTGITAVNNDAWNHIAISRINGVLYLFVNGTQDGAVASGAGCLSQGELFIGRLSLTDTSRFFLGRIDDVRITTGTGRYAGSFTAPTAEFSTAPPYDASYMVSTGPVGMWKLDDATDGVAGTVGANGAIVGSNYNRRAGKPSEYSVWEYSTELTSASSDTRIQLGNTSSYDEFTIECVFNLSSLATPQHIMSKNSYVASSWTDFPFMVSVGTSGTISLTLSQGNGYSYDYQQSSGAGAIQVNTWYHVAARVKNNGTVGLWLNGVPVVLGTIAFALSSNNQPWTIGAPAQPYGGGVGLAGSVGKFCGAMLYNRLLSTAEIYDHHILSGVNPRASSNYSYGLNEKYFTAPINKHLKQLPGFTFEEGMNFTSVGPIEISDVDVNIPQGSSWVIL